MIVEFPMAVFRGDRRAPDENRVTWTPAPDDLTYTLKNGIGVVASNRHSSKTINVFTTKSGTNKEYLQSSGQLENYFQVIHSPREDNKFRETGTLGEFAFTTDGRFDDILEIPGSRYADPNSSHELPHGIPYRALGYSADPALRDFFRIGAERKIAASHKADKHRTENPDFMHRYRNTGNSGLDTTVVEKVCRIPSWSAVAHTLTFADESSSSRKGYRVRDACCQSGTVL